MKPNPTDNPLTSDLFPLPLSGVTLLSLKGDSRAYPMTCEHVLRFHGKVDRPSFEKAVIQVVQFHPQFTAWVDQPSRNRPNWISAGGQLPRIDWGREGEPLKFVEGEFMDLTKEVGWRIWVRQGEDKAWVTFQFHHCCTDGLEAILIIRDLLKSYAYHYDPKQNLALKPPHNVLIYSAIKVKKVGPWAILREISKYVYQPRVELLYPPSRKVEPPSKDYPRLVSHTFSADELNKIKDGARQWRVTINDLLIGNLFLTLRKWNERFHLNNSKRYIKIHLLFNLRQGNEESFQAINKVSFGYLTRKGRECFPDKKFFEGIYSETQRYKSTSLKSLFFKLVRLTEKFSNIWKVTQKFKGWRASAILTNIGDVTPLLDPGLASENGEIIAGNLKLETMMGSPPLRYQTHASFHVMTFAGRMTISVTCTPGLFTMEDTADLLNLFVSEINQSIASKSLIV